MESFVIDSPPASTSPQARAAIVEADVIIGYDLHAQCEFTVFGTPPLESTATLKRPAAMRTLRVKFDGSKRPLEELIALVHAIKGRAGADAQG